MKKASLDNKRNLANANMQKLKKSPIEVTKTYQNEQPEYIQGQINPIKNFIDDKQSWLAWQAINEVNRKKNILKAKLKVASQVEKLHM